MFFLFSFFKNICMPYYFIHVHSFISILCLRMPSLAPSFQEIHAHAKEAWPTNSKKAITTIHDTHDHIPITRGLGRPLVMVVSYVQA
jgi:hypothetical protein